MFYRDRLSDFHRMTVSILKMHFRKLSPTIISYRDISNYHNANFMNSLTETLFEGEKSESFVKDPDFFLTFVLKFLISMLLARRNIFVEIINDS